MIFISLVAFLLICVGAIVLSNIKIYIHYYHGNDNDQLSIKIRGIFGLFRKNIKIPVIKINPSSGSVDFREKSQSGGIHTQEEKKKTITLEKVMDSIESYKDFLGKIYNAKHIINHFFKKIRVRKFTWESTIGTKDAALTAKLSGVIWGVKGLLQNVLYHFFSVNCIPYYNVTPNFNQKLSITDFHCILTVRIGYAILTAIKLFRHIKRNQHSIPNQDHQNKNESI
ncbi:MULTISPECIES: DUF2953 domain-containing protein [Bacillus]|uniref:DUF2953 domain-containing protein n=1 Tax=Bacillus TaxID=1386 RepID=UPI0002DF50EB|nr:MULTISPECIES: DUF2953 domain-containing protein [Bacillus]